MVQVLKHPVLGEIPTVRNPMLYAQSSGPTDALAPPVLAEPSSHGPSWA